MIATIDDIEHRVEDMLTDIENEAYKLHKQYPAVPVEVLQRIFTKRILIEIFTHNYVMTKRKEH